jgi:tetratricopeptide (TPR) repeat protein
MTDQPQPTPTPVSVFYSYAHEDEALRKKLEKHLSLLKRQGFITNKHDRLIVPGTDWARALNRDLNEASIILLLVSDEFLASDYCYSVEMQSAMERHKAKEARVIPIILHPVHWEDAPFGELQALPENATPITSANWHSLNDAFLSVVKGIKQVVYELPILDKAHSRLVVEDYEEALEAYDDALRLNPHSAVAYAGKGDVLSRLKRYKEAVEAYAQAAQLDPTISENEHGDALLAVKQYEEALSAYDQAIRFAPTLPTAYSGKGDVFFQLHRYEKALEAYEMALRLNPSDAQLYVKKGRVLEQLAQQVFGKAKQLGYNEEKHMEQAEKSRTGMHSFPIKVEKLTLLQTFTSPSTIPPTEIFRYGSLGGHSLPLAMSPDGKFLASILTKYSDDYTHKELQTNLLIWEVKTGKGKNVAIPLNETFKDGVSYIHFRPDRQTLLSSRWDSEQKQGLIQAWDMTTGELTQTFPPHKSIRSVISANEQVFVGLSWDDSARVWTPYAVKLGTGKGISSFGITHSAYQKSWEENMPLAISSDGNVLVGAANMQIKTPYEAHDPNGRSYPLNLNMQTLNVWDVPTGKLLYMLNDMPFYITAVAVHSEKRIFASAYQNGTIKLWNLSTAQLLYAFVAYEGNENKPLGPIYTLTFSVDGHQIAGVADSYDFLEGQKAHIKLWQIEGLP